MLSRLLIVHALSPLHAGTGQSSGAVELAIARNKATGVPLVPGSSIKGSLRDRARTRKHAKEIPLFGPPTENASDHAGALMVGDANLLSLPVRSLSGTFGWVTSPYLLRRFRRDLEGVDCGSMPAFEGPDATDQAKGCQESVLLLSRKDDLIVFEDLDLRGSKDDGASRVAKFLAELVFPGGMEDAEGWRKCFRERFCLVSDDVMTFLLTHGTEVVARVALKPETMTVDNLWHQESLPTESLLTSVVTASPNKKTGLDPAQCFQELGPLLQGGVQLGGKATVGRGVCRLVLSSGEGGSA